jgi:hypothetical protein
LFYDGDSSGVLARSILSSQRLPVLMRR